MNEPVVVNLRNLARELNLPLEKVQPVVDLLDEGRPVPFIARYRKDQTGNLGEEEIRAIQTELQDQRLLVERKQTILRSIESLGKLTPDLDQKIREAKTTKRLEDLYLPYKPKKQTLASVAKSKGLEPIALEIIESKIGADQLDQRILEFINEDKGVKTTADVLLGAGHIISEIFSEKLELRHHIREIVQKTCVLVAKKVDAKKEKEADFSPSESSATAPKKPRKRKEKEFQEESQEKSGHDSSTSSETTTSQEESLDSALDSKDHNDSAHHSVSAEINDSAEVKTEEYSQENHSEEDHSGAGGGETEDEQNLSTETTSETPSGQSAEAQSSETEAKDIVVSKDIVASNESSVEATTSKEETVASEEKSHPSEEGKGEENAETANEKSDSSDEVSREFQQWKDRQKEQDKPVVRSQAQLKKKKQAEKKKEKEKIQQKKQEHFEKIFQDYFDFTSEIKKVPPHRVLAINRGEKAKVLRLKFDSDSNAITATAKEICVPQDHPHGDYLNGCAQDAIDRLILPSLEREVRNDLTDNAEMHAVRVFAKNLRSLLLQPPLHRKKVLALDPGYKHGCKMVALDEFGNVLDHATVYLSGSPEKRAAAESTIVEMIQKFQIPILAIGNGTGCRETEEFVSKMITDHFTPQEGEESTTPLEVSYVITNEAGASVYSASALAKEEFPNYDILLRGAISIGRRLQDPLNELVKVEPVSLGVGMYQHDLKAKHLRDTLNDVVESCVNYVGVDLNTATPAILRYVSGLNQLTAKRIYDYRIENGPFKTREELKKVPGLGEVAFTHCAGFLRIPDGPNPLDATWIHPEMYDAATKILEKLGFTVEDLRHSEKVKEIATKSRSIDCAALSEALGIGPHTIYDILTQLSKPGRDPREELPPPIFKKGVLKMEDLKNGMELSGTILNVVDFGAFIDIGLHDSGLIHISQMADRYVRDAHDHVAVGDVVRVWVVDADANRGRISLTMIPPGTQKQFDAKHDRGPRRRDRNFEGEKSHGEGSADRKSTSSDQRRTPRDNSSSSRDNRGRRDSSAENRSGDFRGRDSRSPGGDSRGSFSGSRDTGGGRSTTGAAPRRELAPGEPYRERPNRERSGSGSGGFDRSRSDRRDGSGGAGGRSGGRYDLKSKTYQAPQQEKVVAPISENMKKGKEPLRSFGDLAQLFGRVQAVDPAEEKKRLKEEKKAKRLEQKPKDQEPSDSSQSMMEQSTMEHPVEGQSEANSSEMK